MGNCRDRNLVSLRPADETTNSIAKGDFSTLAKPRACGLHNACIIPQIAVIAVMLERITGLIVNVKFAFRRRILCTRLPHNRVYIPGPDVPGSITSPIQKE